MTAVQPSSEGLALYDKLLGSDRVPARGCPEGVEGFLKAHPGCVLLGLEHPNLELAMKVSELRLSGPP